MLSKIEDDRQTDIPEQNLLVERSHTEQKKMINQMLEDMLKNNMAQQH